MKRSVALVPVVLLLALSPVVQPAANAAFPGRNGVIAFGRTENGRTDIWVVTPAGAASKVTATKRAREIFPDFDSTGTHIVYSRCGPGEFSNCEIWTMNADGSGKVRLTFTSDAQETWPSWSPDGARIAYTSNAEDGFQSVWVMDADGGNQTRLTNTGGFDAYPEWSPDGTRIAFTSDRSAPDDIWVMDADGGNPQRLTRGKKVDERPDWSPDGARIVFSRNGDIWLMDADGSNPTRLTSTPDEDFAPAFSPNGRKIAFDRQGSDGRIGVWVMRANGTRARQLTFGELDFFPDWQPA